MRKIKVVVFDLDATLGSFGQLYIFWKLTKIFLNNENLNEIYLFKLMDNFPLFFRPNLIKLLNNLKNKKIKKICDYVMIYTNNNGQDEWANTIKKYLHYKLKFNLFDKVIRAFEIKGKRVEICRTSSNKSYRDFISCTQLPENTQVCFLDDVYHSEMKNKNVDYIKLEPYSHKVHFNELIKYFYNKNKHSLKINKNQYYDFIKINVVDCEIINKSNIIQKKELIYTENLIKKINIFLNNKSHNKTFKKRKKIQKNTRKLLIK